VYSTVIASAIDCSETVSEMTYYYLLPIRPYYVSTGTLNCLLTHSPKPEQFSQLLKANFVPSIRLDVVPITVAGLIDLQQTI